MTKLIESIENYLNQQDYGSGITQTFLLPRNMKMALLSRIFTLEAKVKELEERVECKQEDCEFWKLQDRNWHKDLEQANSRIKELESELSKWQAPHEDADLQFMKEQSRQSSLAAQQAYINALEWRVKHLESDLKLNASMLAKQSDLAREAETERDGFKNGQEQLQQMVSDFMDVNAKWVRKIKKLWDAIDKHEKFARSHNKVVPLVDEKLYQTRKEVTK